MFDNLTDRLSHTLRSVTGQARLTEENIKDTLREVRRALLEADVSLAVVKDFVERVRVRAVGQEVSKSLSPGQQFVKIVQQELEATMGEGNVPLELKQTPSIILMAGLQGAGKTTSVAKLARFLREREKKKVLVVSADVYRPAAIDQLETLAHEVGVEFFPSTSEQQPVAIAEAAIRHARIQFFDVVLVDTAGRLHIDETMMGEIRDLHRAISPQETLFVVDAMTGQDAANTAQAFHEALPLTGVILTKADGDSRGGAALSVRHITGKPIKFMGMGEKTDALEPFYPDRVASRILGMGDVLSLIEEAERKVDRDKADQLSKKIKKGESFDLEDFRDQLQQLKNMGGMGSLLEKLPGMGQMAEMAQGQASEKEFGKLESMINSMTPKERRKPDLINGSRKRRICAGSGTSVPDLNRLLKQHKQMQKMMKKMGKKGGMQKMMRSMSSMMGGGGMGGPGGGMGGMGGPGGMGGSGGFPRR
ncbi:signal recognition particle protein [Kushneria phyllosphaerae]|uniref:Signal recognition particle protein n=1 Tax=Kushneria phyllosphaerae TaxID=2100822 RepID=A0A2R8CMP6_9GAMM|nr:signal recognition particle protein [Kushneria phyllosphaerae]SPJ34103.1 Signal recognition particle protein [Kushneria phyllosphaerae]